MAMDRWRLGAVERRKFDEKPFVLTADTAHGPRIAATSRPGAAAGARPGMMLADARTLCPEIITAVADPAGDLVFLEKLAVWARRWGPWSAIDGTDGLLVDVTAVAHLFGGEDKLLVDVAAAFAQREVDMRCAIAPTAGAAWALAHHAASGTILQQHEDMKARLGELPVKALRLDQDIVTVLRGLGLKKLGELFTIDSDAINRRFRNRKSPSANPLIRLDQLLGRIPEPLLPVIPPKVPMVQRRLLEPIRHRQLLDQVVGDLAGDMARELEGRGRGARGLELGLWRVDGEVLTRHIELAAATREAAHIVRLFARKLDDVDAGFGIEMLRLRAIWTEKLALDQSDIETASQNHGIALSTLVDRLAVRLGPGAITRLVPFPSHIPERAQRGQPPLEPEPTSQGQLAFHKRPLKLLDKAERIAVLYATPDGYPKRFRWRGEVHDIKRVEGPERIAPEWWRERGSTRLRDYYRIEDQRGRRYWIYRLGIIGDGRGDMPDWYLQGLFA
ncbi:DNA polymerase Y family protein [Qipengyuania flava]|nr:DNA polymerase Y family protein [Qipengyuania flava]